MVRRNLCKFTLLLTLVVSLLVPLSAQAIPKTGQPLPPFDVSTSSGQRVTNLNYSGRVLLVSFSTDYCSACKKAVPSIGELAGRYGKQGFNVLGLFSGFGMENDDLKDYIKTYGVTYPMALFEQRVAEEKFGVISVPYFLLVNKKGVVTEMYRGYSDATLKQLESKVIKLLAE